MHGRPAAAIVDYRGGNPVRLALLPDEEAECLAVDRRDEVAEFDGGAEQCFEDGFGMSIERRDQRHVVGDTLPVATRHRRVGRRRYAARFGRTQRGGAPLRKYLVALTAMALLVAACGDSGGASGLEQSRPVTITGMPLPQFPDAGADPAVGMTMPELEGASFDGTPVTITNDGRPKVLLFLTHW